MTDEKSFIEECVHNNNVEAIINRAKEIVTELYPIIIPSYKNRYRYMYDYFEEHKMQFYVFVYEDDFFESKYNEYNFKYGTIIRITPDDLQSYGINGKGISQKRFYIQKYAEQYNLDKYFLIDDDYNPYKSSCAQYAVQTDNGKVKLKTVKYVDCLKSLQYIFNAYDLILCSASDRLSLYRYDFNNSVKKCFMNNLYI